MPSPAGYCGCACWPAQILKHAALSANLASEEPIDVVMHNCYPGRDTLWGDYTLKKFVPFNPVDKYTIAIVTDNKTGRVFRVMKGAPQVRHLHDFSAVMVGLKAGSLTYHPGPPDAACPRTCHDSPSV